MPFFQPPVPPLSYGIDLSGQTAVVTGATAGIGLEISRQLILYKVSNLIMAVRNTSKGETVWNSLLSDPAVKAVNPHVTIKVMELDTENYASVQRFVSAYQLAFHDLHLPMANAGIGTAAKELASSGLRRTSKSTISPTCCLHSLSYRRWKRLQTRPASQRELLGPVVECTRRLV